MTTNKDNDNGNTIWLINNFEEKINYNKKIDGDDDETVVIDENYSNLFKSENSDGDNANDDDDRFFFADDDCDNCVDIICSKANDNNNSSHNYQQKTQTITPQSSPVGKSIEKSNSNNNNNNNSNNNSKMIMKKKKMSKRKQISKKSSSLIRKFTGRIILQPCFKRFIITCIVLYSMIMGILTFFPMDNGVDVASRIIHRIFHIIFTFEVSIKSLYYRRHMLTNGWLLYDLLTVLSSWIVLIVMSILSSNNNANNDEYYYDGNRNNDVSVCFLLLRLGRIMKTLRHATRNKLKHLPNIISIVLYGIPNYFAVLFVLFLNFYIFAILFTFLFGHDDSYGANNEQRQLNEGEGEDNYYNEQQQVQERDNTHYFGTLDKSLLTLFRLFTLDNWKEIYNDISYGYYSSSVDKGNHNNIWWWSWIPFVSFIFVTTFTFAGLVIAILYDSVSFVQYNKQKKKELLTPESIMLSDYHDDYGVSETAYQHTKTNNNNNNSKRNIIEMTTISSSSNSPLQSLNQKQHQAQYTSPVLIKPSLHGQQQQVSSSDKSLLIVESPPIEQEQIRKMTTTATTPKTAINDNNVESERRIEAKMDLLMNKINYLIQCQEGEEQER